MKEKDPNDKAQRCRGGRRGDEWWEMVPGQPGWAVTPGPG